MLLMMLCASCTITVKPLSPQQHHKPRIHHHHRRVVVHKPQTDAHTVDANWMAKYKELETEYGHTVPADQEIKPKNGKFSVPQSVIDHFGDMVRAGPVVSPTP